MPALLHAACGFFATPDGQAVYLAGPHTLTDGRTIGATPFDSTAYLKLLSGDGANLIRFSGSAAIAVESSPESLVMPTRTGLPSSLSRESKTNSEFATVSLLGASRQ